MTDTDLFFNPLDEGYIANPFPHLDDMRQHLPVQQTLAGPYAVFRYDDVFALLRDPALSVDDQYATATTERDAIFEALTEEFGDANFAREENHSILTTDPPDHTRLRRLISKAFTPRTIEDLRPMIQGLVDTTLDQLEADGQGDIVDRLAFPLPFDVISAMLGMPEADKDQLAAWSSDIVKTLDPILTEEDARQAAISSIHMRNHLTEVIEWKRANPGDDLLTAMIIAEEDGDRMTNDELRDQVSLLFIAGHETTVNLIGTGIYELLRNPAQLARWQADPTLAAKAVDELLRYIAPVQFSLRITKAELSMRGTTIPPGNIVLACLASANRDPEQWGPTANDLDLARANAGQHVSFGSGSHYCLGSSLAKLEAQIAIGSFISRFPNPSIVGEPQWNGRMNLRGLEHFVLDVG